MGFFHPQQHTDNWYPVCVKAGPTVRMLSRHGDDRKMEFLGWEDS